jgi:hypothetical protein
MLIPLTFNIMLGIERKKFMAKVLVENRVITDQKEKKDTVWEFYNNLLGTTSQQECDCFLGSSFFSYEENILFSPVIWFVHPLSIIQLDPPDV